MAKKNKGKKKPAGPKMPKTDDAMAVPAPQRSSDRLSADAPEWHPSSCFTATAATIVENTPTPPVPTQADFSPVEAVAGTADSAPASADDVVLDTDMPSSPEGEGVDQMEREILVPTPTPTATAMDDCLPEENGVPHAASPAAVAADAVVAAAPVSTTTPVGISFHTDAKSPPVESREAEGDTSATAAATSGTTAGFPSEGVSAAATTGVSVSVDAAPTGAPSEEEAVETVAAVEGGYGGEEEEGVVAQSGAADAVPAEVSLTAEAIFKKSEDCARVAPSPAAACAGVEASISRKDDDLLSTAAAVPAPPHEAAEASVTVVAAAETEATVVCAAEVVPTTDAAAATTSSPDYPSLHDPETEVAGETNGVIGGDGDGDGGDGDGRSKTEEAFYRGAAKEKLGAADGEELVPDTESTDEATYRTEEGGSECFDRVAPSKGDVDQFLSNGNGGKGGGQNGDGGENGKSSRSGGSVKGLLANPTLRWGVAALAAVVVLAVGVSRGRRPR